MVQAFFLLWAELRTLWVQESSGYSLDLDNGAQVTFQLVKPSGTVEIYKADTYNAGKVSVDVECDENGLYQVRADALDTTGSVYLQKSWTFIVGTLAQSPFDADFESGTEGWLKKTDGQPVERVSGGAAGTAYCAKDQIDFSTGKDFVGIYKTISGGVNMTQYDVLTFYYKWEQSGVVIPNGGSVEFKVELTDANGNTCVYVSSNSVYGKKESDGTYWGFQKSDVFRDNLPPDSDGWGKIVIPLDVFTRFSTDWSNPVDLAKLETVFIGANSFTVNSGTITVYVDEIKFIDLPDLPRPSYTVAEAMGDSAHFWSYGNSNQDNLAPRIVDSSEKAPLFGERSFKFQMKQHAPAYCWLAVPYFSSASPTDNYTTVLDLDGNGTGGWWLVFWCNPNPAPDVEAGFVVNNPGYSISGDNVEIFNSSWYTQATGAAEWCQVILHLPTPSNGNDFYYYDPDNGLKPAPHDMVKVVGFYMKPTSTGLDDSPIYVSKIMVCREDPHNIQFEDEGPVGYINLWHQRYAQLYVKEAPGYSLNIEEGAEVCFQVVDPDGRTRVLKAQSYSDGKAAVTVDVSRPGVYQVWADAISANKQAYRQVYWTFCVRPEPFALLLPLWR